MPLSPADYRALGPHARLASKRWRAGASLASVAQAFPARYGITEANLDAILAEIREDPRSPPTWDFPPRPTKASEMDAWRQQYAEPKDSPYGKSFNARFEHRQHTAEMRAHNRARLHADPGRPCYHEHEQDPMTGDIRCARCTLLLAANAPLVPAIGVRS